MKRVKRVDTIFRRTSRIAVQEAKMVVYNVKFYKKTSIGLGATLCLFFLSFMFSSFLFVNVNIKPVLADQDVIQTVDANFEREETPQFIVDSGGIVNEKSDKIQEKDFIAQRGQITTMLADNSSAETNVAIEIKSNSENPDDFLLSVPKDDLPRPGRYTLSATISNGNVTKEVKQDFTWGVLAVNLDKSTYKVGEKATFGMGVLDDRGKTLCREVTLDLEVTDPKGSKTSLSTKDNTIKISDTCMDQSVTIKPDYFAQYVPKTDGKYGVHVRAETRNGVREMDESFEVTENPDFIINRHDTSMRIWPGASYDVRFSVEAKDDFKGTLTESVPDSFEITQTLPSGGKIEKSSQGQRISWPVQMKAGEKLEFSYHYKPPIVSPELYFLAINLTDIEGKTTFSEPRPWQVASDSACTSAATGNWAASGSWAAPCNVATGPVNGDSVTIANAHVITIPTGTTAPATGTVTTIIIGAATTAAAHGITLAGTGTLNSSGAVSITGSTAFNGSSSIVVASGTWNSGGSITMTGGNSTFRLAQVTITTGTINLTGGSSILNSGGTASNARYVSTGASNFNISGSYTPGSMTGTNNGTITFNGTSVTQSMLAATNYYTVIVNGTSNTVATAGDMTINTTLTLTSVTSTFSLGGNLTVTGNFTNNSGASAFSPGTNTVTFNKGSSTQTLNGGGSSFYNLIHSGAGILQLESALTVTNDLTNSAGTLDTKSGSNYAVNITGNYAQTGGTVTAQTSNITVGGNWTSTGVFVHAGTVDFNGSGTQVLNYGIDPLYNVTHTGSGTVQLATSSWTKNQKIDISNSMVSGGSNLTNFPVLIKIQDESNPLFTTAQTDGDDIAFKDASGNRLSHEIERYVPTAGSRVLWAWVKIPTLSASSATSVYMFYGNGSATSQQRVNDVWSEGYVAVWHFKECAGAVLGDSTSYGNNGTIYHSPTWNTNGKIGCDLTFDGTYDYVQAPHSTSLNLSSAITVESWVNTNDPDGGFIVGKSYSDNGWILGTWTSPTHTGDWEWFSPTYSTGSASQGVNIPGWTYLSGMYDGIYTTIDTNKTVASVSYSSGLQTNTEPLRIGTKNRWAPGVTSATQQGDIDEIRISNISRTQGWLDTAYDNENSPSSYLTINSETSSGPSFYINGTFTNSTGTFDANGQNQNFAGAFTLASGSTYTKGGTLTFDGTTTYTDNTATKQNIGAVTVNGTSVTLASSMTVDTMNVSVGTLNLGSSGYTLNLANAGATGTVFSNSGTFTAGTSTVQYSATNSGGNVTVLAVPYSSLQLSGAETYDLGNNLTGGNALTGGVTIDTGATLDTTASNYNIALAGNWTNPGTFTANSSTVSFSGSGKTINAGSSSFNNVAVSNGASVSLLTNNLTCAGTLTVGGGTSGSLSLSGKNVTVTGSFTVANGAILYLYGVETATAPTLDSGSTVEYNPTSGGPPYPALLAWDYTNANLKINAANNTIWLSPLGVINCATFNIVVGNLSTYTGYTITVSGTTTISNGTTLMLQSLLNANTLNNNGTITLDSTMGNDAVISLDNGVTLTNNGIISLGNKTNAIIIQADAGGAATFSGTDIDYGGWGITLSRLTYNPAVVLGASETITLGGDVTFASTVTLNGAGAALTTGSNNMTLSATGTPLTVTTGTFTGTGGTVTYTGSGSNTNVATVAYNNLTFTPSSPTTYNMTGNLTDGNALTGGVTIDTGATLSTTASNYNIALAGNWTNAGTFTANTSSVDFTAGSGTQTIDAGVSNFYRLSTPSTASTRLVQLNSNLHTTSDMWISSGTFDANGYDVTVDGLGGIDGGTYLAKTGSNTFGSDLYVYGYYREANFTCMSGAISVVGNLFLYNVGDYGGTFTAPSTSMVVSGNWSFNSNGIFNHNSGTVTFNGTGAQTITGTNTWNNLTINNTYATPDDTYDVDPDSAQTVSGTLTVTDGQWTPNTGDSYGTVTIGANGVMKPDASASISVSGDFSNSGTFTHNSGTVTLNGAGGSTQVISGDTTFNNLSATASTARTINFAANSTTIVAGTWTATGSSGQHISLGRDGGSGLNQWNINPTAWNVNYVTPSNSNNQAGSPINPTVYTDGGNNTNWFVTNNPPDTPTSLDQMKVDNTDIPTGGWINATSVKFAATVTDTDGDQVRLCVEKDALGTGFSGTEDLCGDLVNSGQTAYVTISSQTDATEYHWQVRAKDANDAYSSSWASYGGNGESERDYGIDTTAPTGGTVKDGNAPTGGDLDWNSDGSLTTVLANWNGTAPTVTVSGLNKYEYAIRRQSDDYYWSVCSGAGTWQSGANWCDNGTTDNFTQNSLNLQTGVTYYVSLKTTDNAGNSATINSNGIQVTPTLSFSIDSNSINFADLNNDNFFTDTETTTFTTSTNASNGYTIQGFMDSLLTGSYAATIQDFYGTWSTPQLWNGNCQDNSNFCGFGYTSSDGYVQGSDRFGSGTKFSKYLQTTPGDILADHVGPINGSTGAALNEQWTVTHKVSVSPSQTATKYTGILTVIVTANY